MNEKTIQSTTVLPELGYIATVAIPQTMIKVLTFQAELASRLSLASWTGNGQHPIEKEPDRSDALIDAAEAGKLLGVNVSWLYKNSKRLPFARKLGRKTLRFSKMGLLKWQQSRRIT